MNAPLAPPPGRDALRVDLRPMLDLPSASEYAQQPDRITMIDLVCEVRGDNGTHTVSLRDGAWTCGGRPRGCQSSGCRSRCGEKPRDLGGAQNRHATIRQRH